MPRQEIDILLVYGSGGHAAQMRRLEALLLKERPSARVLKVSDKESVLSGDAEIAFVLPPMTRKYGSGAFHSATAWIKGMILALRILTSYKVRAMLSTGPGIACPIALVLRSVGLPVVHFETWSRFKTQSPTGKVMYRLATCFFVQNQEQLKFYSKAIYRGRL